MHREQIRTGSRTIEEWEYVLRAASGIADAGERIHFLSGQFLGTPYAESTLVGGPETAETFVINLERVDCMTFLEYVEAMRLSASFNDFIHNLKRVRYKSGVVDYPARNHFFSDWKESNADLIEDVTERVGGSRTVGALKRLNVKKDGSPFLSGIPPLIREIRHIPAVSIDSEVIKNLGSGCYVGIFADLEWLDVTHTGIAVRKDNILSFRHASSQPEYRQVVDQDFREYIAGKPGIVVFRPRGRH